MDDGALIDLVRGFTLLYDKRNSDYKNKLKKQNAWGTIASIMEETRTSGIIIAIYYY
jgi:hypothetical protein